jgi:SAM-dependent methyltransferase
LSATKPLDQWALWLLQRRHGGDPESLRRMLERLGPVRDRVLGNAAVAPGNVVLDVGCGDGLIGFGALDRVGPAGRVIFSDISEDLLTHVETLARDAGMADRCRFVRADAADLAPIADDGVDVVTTRSVLIYVKDKAAAFRAFHRVLRDGGRFSLFEPINAFPRGADGWMTMWDDKPVRDVALKLKALYQSIQPADDPMLDFDEHDLFLAARDAGFADLHLALDAKLEPVRTTGVTWETYIRSSWNPKIPTLEEAMAQALTSEERERYEAHLRPQIESGSSLPTPSAVAYLWGRK